MDGSVVVRVEWSLTNGQVRFSVNGTEVTGGIVATFESKRVASAQDGNLGVFNATLTAEENDRLGVPDESPVAGGMTRTEYRSILSNFVTRFEADTALLRAGERAFEVAHPGERANGRCDFGPPHPWHGLSETELANRAGNVCDPSHIKCYHNTKRELEQMGRV